MSDGHHDDLGVVESVDDAEGEAMEEDAVMASIDERPPVRTSEDGLDGAVDRGNEAITEPGPGLVVVVGSLGELGLGLAK